ncbi:hypothetical protein PV325_010250 [Microctonus aethiopoides]|nr:hypothetical protein PV325_010250 [Microctonus aethiopoides]KAK0098615.1 hypothetical protein PV326_006176 [Microctonus aethiopoides]
MSTRLYPVMGKPGQQSELMESRNLKMYFPFAIAILRKFDDVGGTCNNIDSADLEPQDADAIVHQHNEYRNTIASGEETRGKPGPQPPAKNMMELVRLNFKTTWDIELAKVARRWVIQCIPKKDECRDVDRMSVWQNVHILDVDTLDSETSSLHRIPFHIQSWLDDVENFDNAEVGMVNYTKEERGPYIGIAAGKISRIGCGRAMYSVNMQEAETIGTNMTQIRKKKNATTSSSDSNNVNSITSGSSGSSSSSNNNNNNNEHLTSAAHLQRLEVLVCNYGPIDRTTPQNLYEDGMPGQCPTGFDASQRYEYLCKSRYEEDEKKWINPVNIRSSSNIVKYCVWTSFIFAQLCRSLVNVLLSSGWR